jgi:hypothetical protein
MERHTIADHGGDVVSRENRLGSGGRLSTCQAHNGDIMINTGSTTNACEAQNFSGSKVAKKNLIPNVTEVPGLPNITLFASSLEVTRAPLTACNTSPTKTWPDCAAPPHE